MTDLPRPSGPLWMCVGNDSGRELVMVTDMKAFLRGRLDVTDEFESPDSPSQDNTEPPSIMTNAGSERVEHAIRMSSGAMQVRYEHPDIERIFPLAEWIRSGQRFGGKVYRRVVVVVEDWEEVPRG